MICFHISLFILAAFFLLTFCIAIYFSRKKTTFREYAVGNKDFATATMVATVLATIFGGGGLVLNIECTYEMGLWWIGALFLDTFGFWIISRLALRMGPFMQHFSLAETLGSIYGTYPRIIAALIGICGCIIIITMQINVMAQAIGICFPLQNPFVMAIFSSLFLIFYSIFGGVRAVTFTDILQFLTFSIVIPLMAWFMFVTIGKPVVAIVPMLHAHTRFQFSSLFHFDTKLIAMFFFAISNLVSYINAPVMQRVYMSSGPIQAQRVFSYATLFNFFIMFFIVLVGLFVFAGVPNLPKEAIWDYLMVHISPIFRAFVSISLLAMAMSTADSCLNTCAVMVSHDILKSLQKAIPDGRQLTIARWTTLGVGLLAILLAFCCQDLLKLIFWSLACDVPIIVAPFILAVFGFRGTSRTALIGMATGVLTILAWNKWVKPLTEIDGALEIDGSFFAMLANGVAMMAAHYLLKQPKGAGWIGPDHDFKQIQQVHARKIAERKEAIQNGWANRKHILIKLIPSDTTLRLTGLYIITTAIFSYWYVTPDRIYWAICQGLLGGVFTCSKTFFNRKSQGWFVGLGWLMGVAVCLPLNLLSHWWHLVDPIFTTSLSLAHCFVVLYLLPLYLGIGVVAITSLVAMYPIATGLSFALLLSLFPLFMASLLILAMAICLKIKQARYITQIIYLKDQKKLREAQQLKASLYDAAIAPSTALRKPQGYGAILAQVVGKVEESISFLDSKRPISKQDFQSVIDKLYDWVAYFNNKSKSKAHVLLQPNQISLDKLMRRVELALSQEVTDPPRLLVETISTPHQALCPYIVCDIHQVVYLLVQVILRVGKLETCSPPVVRIQLHATVLKLNHSDTMDGNAPVSMLFQAIALVVSQPTTSSEALPKVKALYDDRMDLIGFQGQQVAPPSIDLQQETISTIVWAHYGYLEVPSDQEHPTMLLVLPHNVVDMLSKITTKLPIDSLTPTTSITPKEQADSMMALMQFHDYVCTSVHQEGPIDIATISGLLLLLRQHFGFKRHESGQLFYVRAVGIAQLVIEWVSHAPKVMYASLLYELVRHTCLSLAYVKEHYHLAVYAFVFNVIGIHKREELFHPSLLYVQDRLQEALKEDHVPLSVLFIKLAERLYDLRHAAGYGHLTEVQRMARETLTIDVKLANEYLGVEIGAALEKAAKEALAFCKGGGQERDR